MKVKVLFVLVLFVSALACSESKPVEKTKEKKKGLHEIKLYDKKKYRPVQPISFSHKTHVPEGMTCGDCHKGYTEKDTIRLKSPLNSVEVKKVPDHLTRNYQHKNPEGDMSDCSRCHY